MTAQAHNAFPAYDRSAAAAWRWAGVAFVYWLAAMTMLEPGNVAGALDAGLQPPWGLEALRLVVAGLLGAAATPAMLFLIDRYPVGGGNGWLHAALQGLGVLVLAPALIVVSCVLAAWLLQGRIAPSPAYVGRELFANSLLLIVLLSGFLAIIQVARRLARASRADIGAPSAEWADRLSIKDKGRLTVLDVQAVDWIETQGNYQALHVGGAVHLIRETSTRLAGRLDPARFVRIHRRSIVALDRVREVEALPNGDAIVRLVTGAELRLARSHRETLRSRLQGKAGASA